MSLNSIKALIETSVQAVETFIHLGVDGFLMISCKTSILAVEEALVILLQSNFMATKEVIYCKCKQVVPRI